MRRKPGPFCWQGAAAAPPKYQGEAAASPYRIVKYPAWSHAAILLQDDAEERGVKCRGIFHPVAGARQNSSKAGAWRWDARTARRAVPTREAKIIVLRPPGAGVRQICSPADAWEGANRAKAAGRPTNECARPGAPPSFPRLICSIPLLRPGTGALRFCSLSRRLSNTTIPAPKNSGQSSSSALPRWRRILSRALPGLNCLNLLEFT